MTSRHSDEPILLASGFTPDAEFHLNQPSKEFNDVRTFHKKFELLCFDEPGHLSAGKLRERIEFMQEELDEFIEGAGFGYNLAGDIEFSNPGPQDLAKQADALVDLVYVALGTAVQLGLPWDHLWDDVQRANMSKVRGMTKRGHKVDVTKPPGWTGPQTELILTANGYDASRWFYPAGMVTQFNEKEARDDVQR